MKRTFKHSLTALMLLCSFTFLSCNNKKIDGTWEGTINTGPVRMTFHSIESDPDGGGKIEMTFSSKVTELSLWMHPLPLGGSNATLDCRFDYSVTGRWYVKDENLNISFKISTLKIKVNEEDVDAKIDEYRAGFYEYYGDDAQRFMQDERESLIREVKEAVQKGILESEKRSKIEMVGENFELSGNEMSFDMYGDRRTLHRVSKSE